MRESKPHRSPMIFGLSGELLNDIWAPPMALGAASQGTLTDDCDILVFCTAIGGGTERPRTLTYKLLSHDAQATAEIIAAKKY